MKNLIKILSLTVPLFISSGLKSQNNFYFSKTENDSFSVGEPYLIDYDGDFSPDALCIKYDKNRDGKVDHYAIFRITNYNDSIYEVTVKDKAFMLGLDLDEDGIKECIFLDMDLDGTLETFFENPAIKKKESSFKTNVYL